MKKKICRGWSLLLACMLLAGCAGNTSQKETNQRAGAFSQYDQPDGEETVFSCDVVVVGAGLAGLSAAVTAAGNGSSVILLEKMPGIGGNSIYSNGTFNAVDPVRQGEKGIEDSLDLYIKQTYEGGGCVGNLDLITILCEGAGDARDWLEEHGARWSEKGVYLPTGGAWPRSLDAANGANESFIRPLAQAVVQEGGRIIRDHRVVALIRKEDRIVGVRAVEAETGTERIFWAEQGVVLATGGFGSNPEMIAQYCQDLPEGIESETTPAATGDGILLALRVGAGLTGMQYAQMVPGAAGDGAYLTSEIGSAIYVNQNGERFASEQLPNSELCRAILAQPGGIAYAVFDSGTIGEDYVDNAGRGVAEFRRLAEQGLCGFGETLDQLAASIGVDVQQLLKTIRQFNRIVDGETRDPFGRELFYKKLETPPFYASKRTAKIHYTMGGLRINTEAQVLREDLSPIEGLYACGEVTGGIHGTNHVSGNALADCVVFGRIAGKSVSMAQGAGAG